MRKSFLFVLVLLLFATLVPQASADPIAVNDTFIVINRPGTGGGELGIEDDDPLLGTSFTSFITFCVEFEDKIDFTSLFRAVSFGLTDSHGRALTQGAAWLYEQFLSPGYGALGTVGGGNAYDGTDATATALQHVIWHFQGNQWPLSSIGTNPIAQAYYDLVTGVLGAAAAQAYVGSHVAIMRVDYVASPTFLQFGAQDVLVERYETPEPAALLLVGMGVLLIAARMRRVA